MNLIQLKDRIKAGFHKFCDGTSMHGFTELYYAKTDFWKIVWIIIVGGALAVTTYQITGAVNQYVNQSTATSVQSATQNDLTYPPLKFCIAHWLHWTDHNKVVELNFSKEAFLFGMSYLTNIYTSELFNITQAEESFYSSMLQNNLSTIFSLYQILSKSATSLFSQLPTINEFTVSDWENLCFCYKASGFDIFSYLLQKSNEKEKNILQIDIYDYQFDTIPLVNSEEYNSYMAEWIFTNTKQYYLNEATDGYLENYAKVHNNYSKIHPPNILFVDGYSESNIILAPEIDEYYITVKASAQRLKNKQSYKCKENTKSFASDISCTSLCNLQAKDHCSEKPLKSFLGAVQLESSTEPYKLERNKIYFLNESTGTETTSKTTYITAAVTADTSNETYFESSTGFSTEETIIETNYSTTNTCNMTAISRNCAENNCSMEGCEKWTYSITVTTRSLFSALSDVAYKRSTTVYIHYPQSSDVLIMTEMDSKTWEDFVGNVGGLLGIWTGASVISFLQLFYLFCLTDTNCSLIKCWKCISARYNEVHHISLSEPPKIVQRKTVLKEIHVTPCN